MIYIYAPARYASGGPELAHQLGYQLKQLGLPVCMAYYARGLWQYPYYRMRPVHENYKKYELPVCVHPKTTSDDVVVVPESVFWKVSDHVGSKCYLWWMSVDNYYACGKMPLCRVESIGRKKFDIMDASLTHLVQSEYAREFLLGQGVPKERVYRLSDYLREDFVEGAGQFRGRKKKQILYNPQKGMEYTQKLMEAAPDLTWVPLQGYTPQELSKVMGESMLYIDFGNHPGKDRMPRETVLSGCCLLTGRRGAAGNRVDIPIDEEFKYADTWENIPAIIEKVRDILNHYENYTRRFDAYRKVISGEKATFCKDVNQIFGNGK